MAWRMVALLLYARTRLGIRSARAIERACREDVACRVTAMLEQHHATIQPRRLSP
jgi:hypothetical protein